MYPLPVALCVGEATCPGDCHPTLLICGLPPMLPGPCWCSMLGSSVWGGPYAVGCEVGRILPVYPVDVVDAGLPTWTSRRWTGSELLVILYMVFIFAISAAGDMDMLRWAGEGVETGDPCVEPCSPSDRLLTRAAAAAVAPRANASAVALAASSRVPVW